MKAAATRLRAFVPAAFASLLGACGAFGPGRNPPPMAEPAHYAARPPQEQAPDEGGTAIELTHGAPIPRWWTTFGSAQLDALVAEGLDNNPSLAAARASLQAAHEALKAQIGRSMLPGIDAGFSPSRQRSLGLPVLPQQTFLDNIFAAEVQASYTFDFFGAAVLADRALGGQVLQQNFEFEAARRALATNIVVAAIDSASLEEQLAAGTRSVEIAGQRAADARARQRLGALSPEQTLMADEDAADAASQLPALRARALAVRHALALLLGRSPDRAPAPLALSALRLPTAIPLSVPSELLHQRPDILAAEVAVRAAADQAGAASASMFPSLTLSAAVGRGGFDWSTFTSPAGAIWSVGATLTQPLLHGGALVARRRQYEANHAAAVSLYRQTVLAAFQNVADTLVALEEDADSVAQTGRAERDARDLEQDAERRYRLGAAPRDATLVAQQVLQNAHVQAVRAQSARLAHGAALFDSMGEVPAIASR